MTIIDFTRYKVESLWLVLRSNKSVQSEMVAGTRSSTIKAINAQNVKYTDEQLEYFFEQLDK